VHWPGREPGDAALPGPGSRWEATAEWATDDNQGVVTRDLGGDLGRDLGGDLRTAAGGRARRDSVGSLERPELFGGVRFDTDVGVEPARLASIGACDLGGVCLGGYAEELVGTAQ
jgi:hypothetical protein